MKCGRENKNFNKKVSRMVDITEISAMVAAAGVLVGVVYYILDMRHQSKVRKTDLVMRLYSTWGSKELSEATLKIWNLEFKDYNDFVKRYGPCYSETEVYAAFRMVSNFFNGLGILLLFKLVDVDMVARTFSGPTRTTWEKVKPLVEGGRKQRGPRFFEDFEYLYNEIKKREQAGVKNG
jgi:hypothetical protein